MKEIGAQLLLGTVVADLTRGELTELGTSQPLTPKEQCFLESLATHGLVSAETLGWTRHEAKQVVYRLRRKLPAGVLKSRSGGYSVASRLSDPEIIGRAPLLAAAELMLHRTGTVALVGAAGAGKTRMARALEFTLNDMLSIVWVDGHRCTCEADLEREFVRVLRTEVRALLLDDAPIVVVLDNLELIEDIGPLLQSWRELGSQHRWILTSRFAIPEIEPVHVGVLDQAAAIDLLSRRGVEGPLDILVSRFDCLPLILELVAARARTGQVGAVLAMSALEVGSNERVSMRDLVHAMWVRLTSRLQTVLAAAVVPLKTTSAEALSSVCGATEAEIEALVDASVLARDGDSLRVLEVIRELVRELRGEALPLEAHARWVVSQAEVCCAELDGAGGIRAFRHLLELEPELEEVVRHASLGAVA